LTASGFLSLMLSVAPCGPVVDDVHSCRETQISVVDVVAMLLYCALCGRLHKPVLCFFKKRQVLYWGIIQNFLCTLKFKELLHLCIVWYVLYAVFSLARVSCLIIMYLILLCCL